MNIEKTPLETGDAGHSRLVSPEPKKPTAWIAAAVILPLAFLSWFLLGSRLLGSFWVPGVTVLGLGTCLLPIIICGLKEKFAFVAISLIGILLFSRVQILFDAAFALAVVGAVRIAKPTSEWARRYYGSTKMAQALTRFALPTKKSDPKQEDSGLPAPTRRKIGWIIAAIIGGLILLIPVLLFVGGVIAGMLSGSKSQRQAVATDATVPSSTVTKRDIPLSAVTSAVTKGDLNEREVQTALQSLQAFGASMQAWLKRRNCGQDKECAAKEFLILDRLAHDADNYLGQSPVLWGNLQATKSAKALSEDDVAKQTARFQAFDNVALKATQFAKAIHEYKNSRTVQEMDKRRKATVVAKLNLEQAFKDVPHE